MHLFYCLAEMAAGWRGLERDLHLLILPLLSVLVWHWCLEF